MRSSHCPYLVRIESNADFLSRFYGWREYQPHHDSVTTKIFVVVCCQTIWCLLSFKEGNNWISSAACLFSPMKENKKFTNVFTLNISELAALKLVML